MSSRKLIVGIWLASAGALLGAGKGAAQSPFWADLEPGAHAVGFRVADTVDATRSFPAPSGGMQPRPMRLYVWYPARAGSGAPITTASLIPEFVPFGGVLAPADLEAFGRQFMSIRLGSTPDAPVADSVVDRLRATPLFARADAAPAEGQFPVVLFPPGSPLSMPVTAEYLASHGFIVVGMAHRAHNTVESREFTPNPRNTEAEADDLAFALGAARGWRNADARRLGVVGYSSSSLSNLAFAFQSRAPLAVAAFEGWEAWTAGQQHVQGARFFDPASFRSAYLLLEKQPEEASPAFRKTSEFFDSIRFAPRWRVSFEGASHGDFSTLRVALPEAPAALAHTFTRAHEYLLAFLQSRLGDAPTENWVPTDRDPAIQVATFPVAPAAMSAEEFFHLSEMHPQQALDAMRANAATRNTPPPFTEASITRLANLTNSRNPAAALTLYEIVTLGYPNSARAAARLSDALWTAGHQERARTAARRALELIDIDAAIPEDQRAPLRTRMQARTTSP